MKIDVISQQKNLEVRFQPHLRIEPMAPAIRLTRKTMPDAKMKLEASLQGLTASSFAIQNSKESQERKDQAKMLIEQNLKKSQEQLERINAAIELQKKVHDSTIVHARVVYDTGAGKVVIAQTKGASDAAAPAAAPAE